MITSAARAPATPAPPGRRACTYDFKIAQVDKWLKQRLTLDAAEAVRAEALLSAESPEHAKRIMRFYAPDHIMAQVGLGISLDEIGRMKPNMDPETLAWKENTFPLLMEVAYPLTRQDCINLIAKAGLPIPPKSACVFCPFHSLRRWQEMRQQEPVQFWYAADLETYINERRKALGKDPVWFSSKLKPLAQATTDFEQHALFEEESPCESGYCFV